jgi:4-hydroxy-tetrahydrodipicolinate reductase
MIKLAINGAGGRMGSRIIALAKRDKEFLVTVGLEQTGHPQLGSTLAGVLITDDISFLKQVDCFIDFTQPAATLERLVTCVSLRLPMVIGTTGFDEAGVAKIKTASKKIPIVFSPNLSIGVNLVFKVVADLAGVLRNYQVKIIETHHVHKKDAPSGTAKKIAQIVEEASSHKVEDIKSIREGEIVGDHEIIFGSEFDSICLKHSAKTRDIFAQGALLAAKWVVHKRKGLYGMQDCLI